MLAVLYRAALYYDVFLHHFSKCEGQKVRHSSQYNVFSNTTFYYEHNNTRLHDSSNVNRHLTYELGKDAGYGRTVLLDYIQLYSQLVA